MKTVAGNAITRTSANRHGLAIANQRLTVSSGSIAELDVARFALNVLEGTKRAFDNRRHKYEAFPELT